MGLPPVVVRVPRTVEGEPLPQVDFSELFK